jgi:hypothetical protein
MHERHNELREELVAILGAGRELPADVDRQLADAFLHYLERQEDRQAADAARLAVPHQPHYSLTIAGGVWGAALMFLFLVLVLDNPNPLAFILVAALVLGIVTAITRTFLYLARYGWQMPHIKVVPPTGKP